MGAAATNSKITLRDALRTARRERAAGSAAADDAARCAALLALPELRAAGCVAAYAAVPSEPDPAAAVAALRERGVRVLLPRLLPDLDLDWAEWHGGALVASPVRPRLREPAGRGLGRDALADADVVVVPALAVAPGGARLGQGGGSYDRALLRARPSALLVALVGDDEVVEELPAEPHDVRVDLAVTPTRVVRLRHSGPP
ncbi:5-formyltetrahydrofolate cyclo-ligase [Motilibacter peucedani]|uniref:5-formyltetrahydrofolate cyclo-ligase n=2 Tax=Motilibacter peucedani TaxID=598650 RepID=A0A420XKD1_9ACTN|nr:5-formyltetrahydrofolate cyclo-ligase [Motilibacter peucedani]